MISSLLGVEIKIILSNSIDSLALQGAPMFRTEHAWKEQEESDKFCLNN